MANWYGLWYNPHNSSSPMGLFGKSPLHWAWLDMGRLSLIACVRTIKEVVRDPAF